MKRGPVFQGPRHQTPDRPSRPVPDDQGAWTAWPTRNPPPPTPGGAERKAKILELAERTNVKFMRLQFTDILGVIKNVEIPNRQFASALDGQIMFDGSSIEGFVRIEESDMFLRPDLSTFQVLPGTQHTGERIGRLICDIHNPDGSPFEGCPGTP